MFKIISVLSALTAVLACPQHDVNHFTQGAHGLAKRAGAEQDWAYEASFNWAKINRNYTLCQMGTQQSPIPLTLTGGLALNHTIDFNYTAVHGNLYNWGYGPGFVVNDTVKSSITFDEETVFLKSWHIHAPADHSVQGDRSKAELHFVHADATGKERAVVAMRIDPGNAASNFFNQFPSVPMWDNTTTTPMSMDPMRAISEVNNFSEFWTYQGSLTSPPCTESIRWFVARNVLFTSVKQMQAILEVSTYSARVEQEVWQHQINV